MTQNTIFVTKPYLPPIEEFIPYLNAIWDSKIITNCGPLHEQLENELCAYLGVPYISLFSNGTLALVTALQSMRITGEVITTPYSFVATSHSLLWKGVKPVFVDVDPNTFNIDPLKIESAITPNTTAILAVHCYGNPCDVFAIQRIAETYNLRVIYDAAHAFAVKYENQSLLNFGDLSVLSFHATKVFNTFEGGAIVCDNINVKTRLDQLKNFGHSGETNVVATGINAKMSEINAAMGLLQLKHVDEVISTRKLIDAEYRELLSDIKGINCLEYDNKASCNYSYFPILVTNEFPLKRDELYECLKDNGIHARRYFYPLISEFPMYRYLPSASRDNLPNAYALSNKILCLPIYPGLNSSDIGRIVSYISKLSNQS